MAWRSSKAPAFGVYLVYPSRIALIPAFFESNKEESQRLIGIDEEKNYEFRVNRNGSSTSAMSDGVSKSGSPAANRMTGTPAWTRAVARSVIATVFDGLMELTRGLREMSSSILCSLPLTAIALTTLLDTRRVLVREGEGKARDFGSGPGSGPENRTVKPRRAMLEEVCTELAMGKLSW